MITLKLDKTTPHGGMFLQEWTIVDHDGSEHGVITDCEWNEFCCDEGAERIFDVEGTKVRADQLVACSIASGMGATLDGEDYPIDAKWLAALKEQGFNMESLTEPAS